MTIRYLIAKNEENQPEFIAVGSGGRGGSGQVKEGIWWKGRRMKYKGKEFNKGSMIDFVRTQLNEIKNQEGHDAKIIGIKGIAESHLKKLKKDWWSYSDDPIVKEALDFVLSNTKSVVYQMKKHYKPGEAVKLIKHRFRSVCPNFEILTIKNEFEEKHVKFKFNDKKSRDDFIFNNPLIFKDRNDVEENENELTLNFEDTWVIAGFPKNILKDAKKLEEWGRKFYQAMEEIKDDIENVKIIANKMEIDHAFASLKAVEKGDVPLNSKSNLKGIVAKKDHLNNHGEYNLFFYAENMDFDQFELDYLLSEAVDNFNKNHPKMTIRSIVCPNEKTRKQVELWKQRNQILDNQNPSSGKFKLLSEEFEKIKKEQVVPGGFDMFESTPDELVYLTQNQIRMDVSAKDMIEISKRRFHCICENYKILRENDTYRVQFNFKNSFDRTNFLTTNYVLLQKEHNHIDITSKDSQAFTLSYDETWNLAGFPLNDKIKSKDKKRWEELFNGVMKSIMQEALKVSE